MGSAEVVTWKGWTVPGAVVDMIQPGALENCTGMAQYPLLGRAFTGSQIAAARPAGGALSDQVELANIAVDAAGPGGHKEIPFAAVSFPFFSNRIARRFQTDLPGATGSGSRLPALASMAKGLLLLLLKYEPWQKEAEYTTPKRP